MKALLCATFLSLCATAFALPARHPTYEPKAPSAKTPASPTAKATPAPDAPRLIPVSFRQRFSRDVPSALPQTPGTSEVTLRGWRGERVLAQVLIESLSGFQEVSFEPCMLHAPDGKAVPVRLDVVRYTLAKGKLVADILDGTEQQSFEGVVRPLLLSVDIPQDAPAQASGELAVRVNGKRLALQLRLDVEPGVVLPPPAQWKCHVDFWQHPDAVARWHDVPMWSPEHFALLRGSLSRLASLGQKTITATLIDEAWNAQTYDRFRSMVAITRTAEGAWVYDFSALDRWVDFMDAEIGLKQASIHCYSMLPWSLSFPYFDASQGKTVAPTLKPGSAEYEAFWAPYLKALSAHAREKGWGDRLRIAMDERPDELLLPALDVVKRHAPELKIVMACNEPSAINDAFADVSYSYGISEKLFPLAQKRRAQGQTTTFYICCSPNRPNTFMASSLAESEWLLPFAAHCGLDGILRWAYQSWVENPLLSQDYTSWPSGDTSLVYPGNRSSLRLEALRNGIETFEKIRLLRALATEKNRPEALKPLEDALKVFTVARGKKAGVHEGDLAALDAALEQTVRLLCAP